MIVDETSTAVTVMLRDRNEVAANVNAYNLHVRITM
jgi:hypothetical protein